MVTSHTLLNPFIFKIKSSACPSVNLKTFTLVTASFVLLKAKYLKKYKRQTTTRQRMNEARQNVGVNSLIYKLNDLPRFSPLKTTLP